MAVAERSSSTPDLASRHAKSCLACSCRLTRFRFQWGLPFQPLVTEGFLQAWVPEARPYGRLVPFQIGCVCSASSYQASKVLGNHDTARSVLAWARSKLPTKASSLASKLAWRRSSRAFLCCLAFSGVREDLGSFSARGSCGLAPTVDSAGWVRTGSGSAGSAGSAGLAGLAGSAGSAWTWGEGGACVVSSAGLAGLAATGASHSQDVRSDVGRWMCLKICAPPGAVASRAGGSASLPHGPPQSSSHGKHEGSQKHHRSITRLTGPRFKRSRRSPQLVGKGH